MIFSDLNGVPVPSSLSPESEGVCNVKILHSIRFDNEHEGEFLKVFFEAENGEKFIQDIKVSDDITSLFNQLLDLTVTGGHRRTGHLDGYVLFAHLKGSELTAIFRDNGEVNEIIAFLPYGTKIEDMDKIISPYWDWDEEL